MDKPERVDVGYAWDKVASEEGDSLLVCAYEDESKCCEYYLKGSITAKELEGKKDRLDKNREIIFYCN